VIAGVPVAMLWMWIFNPTFGVLNTALAWFGIQGPQWLFDPAWVIPAFIVMSLWGIGGAMVIYLAALQGVPQHLYEAAELDGANVLARFRHVTLPMLSPVIFFNVILSIIGSFQAFTQAFIMTQGGPANASLFYVLYLYRNAFQYFKMGYASAMAWLLLVIIMALTLLVFRSSSVWVFYEGEGRG
jgi:multiple sugar transport system permease protein